MTKSRFKIIQKKWLLGIIFFLVAIWLLSTFALEPIIKHQLVKQVSKQTQGQYALEVDKVDCSIFQRRLQLYSVRLVPCPSLSSGRKAVFSGQIEELELAGIQIWRLVRHKEFVVNQLNISGPEVHIRNGLDQDTTDHKGAESGQASPFVQIETFKFKNGNLTVIGHDSTKSIVLSDVDLFLKAFVYDENQTAEKKHFDFEDLSLSIKSYYMALPDSFYALQTDAISASSQDENIQISGLALVPLYGPHQFMEKKGEQADRLNIFVKELQVDGLDFDRLLEKELMATFVTIDSLNLVAYRDKRYILPADKYVKFPQQALRELPHPVHIDSVLLHNAQITYRERVEGSEAPGHINFVNINALTNNVTNDPALLDDSIAIITNATGYLMGAGKITAHITIPIGNEQNVHYFEGGMSSMEMNAVNPMLKHIVFGEVVSGKVNELSFSAYVNEDESKGKMRFGYEDFKVQINHQESEKGRKGFLTFIANSFIVKSDNPSNGEFRESEMHYVRDKRKSLINFWWKTILSGFKDTMGIPEGKEEGKPEG